MTNHLEHRTSRIFKRTKTVGFAEVALGATPLTIPFDDALPADAAVVGSGLDVTAAFVNAAGTMGCDLGDDVDPDRYVNGAVTNLDGIAKVSQDNSVALPGTDRLGSTELGGEDRERDDIAFVGSDG